MGDKGTILIHQDSVCTPNKKTLTMQHPTQTQTFPPSHKNHRANLPPMPGNRTNKVLNSGLTNRINNGAVLINRSSTHGALLHEGRTNTNSKKGDAPIHRSSTHSSLQHDDCPNRSSTHNSLPHTNQNSDGVINKGTNKSARLHTCFP